MSTNENENHHRKEGTREEPARIRRLPARRTSFSPRKGTAAHYMLEYGLLLLGSLIIALSFNYCLKPNQVASGGVTGISVITLELFGFQPALVQWALNIPLFLLGVFLLGKQFGLKTAVGSFVLPLFVLLTQNGEPLTDNLLLATIYGGIGIGVGLGIVFRGRGSTGGLDLAAQLIHRFTGISLGIAVAMLDGLVILTAGLVFDAEKALFALIGLYVTSKTIDVVQLGFNYAKVAYIISEETEAITRSGASRPGPGFNPAERSRRIYRRRADGADGGGQPERGFTAEGAGPGCGPNRLHYYQRNPGGSGQGV